jgi:hypothetical protein
MIFVGQCLQALDMGLAVPEKQIVNGRRVKPSLIIARNAFFSKRVADWRQPWTGGTLGVVWAVVSLWLRKNSVEQHELMVGEFVAMHGEDG